jgi:UDP-2-acetamido-3-amino-2,3-dideoxy-glucuronate N-acetyltransferase
VNQLIHASAACESSDIGSGTRVGAFAFIAKTAQIGRNCLIGAHVSIEEGVVIGDKVVIETGVTVSSGTTIEDEVSIGAYAAIALPQRIGPATGGKSPTTLRRGCTIGAHAALHRGISIGEDAVVEAGAVVTRSVQRSAVAGGNPAVVRAFVTTAAQPLPSSGSRPQAHITKSGVRGVATYEMPLFRDPRGNLTVGEFERTLPFTPKRFFMTLDVPSFDLRGEHAHRTCEQFLLCLFGSCAVVVDDGANREEFLLDRPTFGIYVPPMVWATEYKHSPDSRLVVFASEYYDPAEYIRDYRIFLSEAATFRAASTTADG